MGPARFTQCRAVIWILNNRRFLFKNISQHQTTVGFIFSEKKKYQNWRSGWFRLFPKHQRTGDFHDELAKNPWWLESQFF
jgi:ribosomal protein L17